MVNIRTKGQTGEREIANDLSKIIRDIYIKLNLPIPRDRKGEEVPFVQRNQMQTASGGHDITGTFDLAIEIKRQEALSINTWWKQAVSQAARADGVPVLLYRQSRKPWKVVMMAQFPFTDAGDKHEFRVEYEYADFLLWFADYALEQIQSGKT